MSHVAPAAWLILISGLGMFSQTELQLRQAAARAPPGSQGPAADVSAVCLGLIGPGDRKSVQRMGARLAPGDYDQLHHFIADGVWDAAPLESELLVQADRLVGGKP
jgi:SRSO17 transposase